MNRGWAFLHKLSDEVDKHLVEIPGHLHMNMRNPGFVGHNLRGGMNVADQSFAFDERRSDSRKRFAYRPVSSPFLQPC